MAVIGLCLAGPAIAYFCSPLWKRRAADGLDTTFADAGLLADLPVGQWSAVTVEVVRRDGWEKMKARRTAWVRRSGEGDHDVAVLSPICPHLGCPIGCGPNSDQFQCPCHKGTFDSDGRLVSGPPPRGMDGIDWEVRAGRLFVRWQDYKIGVAERTPVEV